MTYLTYGTKVDHKGNWAFSLGVESSSKKQAALVRSQLCSETKGKDRVYKGAVTYRDGEFFRIQTIPGPVN